MNQLELAIAAVSLMKKVVTVDCSILVTDKTGLILALEKSDYIKEPIKVGIDRVFKDSSVYQCIATGQVVQLALPKHVLGVKLRAHAIPLMDDNGEVIGCLAMSQNLENQDKLYGAAQTIASTTEEISATTEDLGSTAAMLAQELGRVKVSSENVLAKIKKTDDILKFVSDVAANSNLLGLNAAIEAARAGEHGRGFTVVADEIRKMAINSANSVHEIKEILQDIIRETIRVAEAIIASVEISERQAAATQEIAATMTNMATAAVDLEKIAEKI